MSGNSKSHRILHISSAHRVDDQRIYEKQCKSLADAGYDVTLFGRKSRSTIESNDSVKVITFKPRGRLYRFTILQLVILAKIFTLRPHIIHFHDPDLLFIGVISRLIGRKVIYDVHENYSQLIQTKQYLKRPIRKPIALIFGGLERHLSKFCSGIVLADTQLSAPFDANKTAIVRNYQRREVFEEALPLPAQNLKETRTLRLIYVGSITEERGALDMVEVVNLLNDRFQINAGLDLVGDVDPVLKKQMLENDRSGHITLHGYLNYKKSRNLIRHSDAGFCILHPTPAYKDAVPVKFLEYLGFGIPVIVSNFERLRTLGTLFRACIFVDPKDPQNIAKRVAAGLESQFLETSKGSVAQEISEKFCWQNEESRLIELYRKIEPK